VTRRLRVAALFIVAGLAASLTPITGFSAALARESAAAPERGYTSTKTITRTHLVAGADQLVDTRDVTVAVDKTTQLRGRERIHVSWSGAHPSGARSANPFGESGMAQEYPVVLLQCRGLDDASLPAAQQLSPDTCWTSTRSQRSQSADETAAVWRHDEYASEADRAQKGGLSPFPDPATCNDVAFLSTHLTPFVAASGKVYPSCTAETMAPEAAVGSAYPPSEMAAFTDISGTGDAQFEVRSDVENQSLGCNSKTPCSLVVIPIMGLSCLDDDVTCNAFGLFPPGSSNFANQGVDPTVSPLFWWAASNWRNRFSVPLTFGLSADACDVLDSRAPTPFYGSELMSQAALQWAPAYCLRKDRFKFQHNRMSEAAAFALMENGQAAGAFVSSRRTQEGKDPVGYAPTAVTGIAISYIIDRPDNAGEFTNLRLNPRLLAKLLTQSYPASSLGQQHPGLANNPLSLNLDPEFQKLNPGLDTIAREAAATVLSLSQSSDVISTVTSYIAKDRDAMAFIDGKADPSGMVVNPSYKGIDLPIAEWPELDTFVPTSETECLKENPAVYLAQVAAPVSYLRTIAEAVLDSWPNVQTRCDRATSSDPFKLGRVDQQGVGTRFMLGITSLGDAARFGLHTAALETTPGHFVGPSDRSLAAAVSHAVRGKPLQPFVISQAALAKDAAAYPGTMVVYTAARTTGVAAAVAKKVALFVRTATTEGQRVGAGNGELPSGFLPIQRRGPTAALFQSAEQVAASVAAQRKPHVVRKVHSSPPAGPPKASPTPKPTAPHPAAVRPSNPATVNASGNTAANGEEQPLALSSTASVAMRPTSAEQSPLAASLLPIMIGLALVGALTSAGLRLRTRGPGSR
jgi:hypothetical protein